VSIFSKTVNISDSLYNAGLAKAKNADMSGAIESLNKSLTLNKKNVAARNLIGLVYYEIGRIGDAIRQWRISLSLIPDQNPAADYIQQLEKNTRQLLRLDDAVHMYNTALDYIRQKSDDMAIIQLKKAVDTNPRFIDALNLLTLCYLIQGENGKAAGTVERTLAIDVSNPLALHYYRLAYADKSRPALAPPPAAKKAAAVPVISHTAAEDTGIGRSFPIVGVISFIIGALSAFAILYILIMPERLAEKDKAMETLQNEQTAQVQALQGQLDGANAENTQLKADNTTLNDKYTALQTQSDLNEKTDRIVSAEQLMNGGLYQEAVDAAAAVDKTGLSSDLQERLQNIIDTSYPQLVEKYYNDGVAFYNKKQYDDAKQQFDNAMKFVQPGGDLGDDVLYYLGRVAVQQNDTESAKNYFQKILDDYPDGKQAANAASRLKQLE